MTKSGPAWLISLDPSDYIALADSQIDLRLTVCPLTESKAGYPAFLADEFKLLRARSENEVPKYARSIRVFSARLAQDRW